MIEQDLARGEREVEVRSLCNDADQSLHLDLLSPHVEVADPCLTVCRAHACGKYADSRRLAGAVWTKQPEDLAACDVERKAVQRHDLARRLLILATWAKPATGSKRWRGCIDFAEFVCAYACE